DVMIVIGRGGGYPLKCRNSYLGLVVELTSKFCSRFAIVGVVILLSVASALADAQRGTLVHEATLHVAPNEDAAKLGQAGRGHELFLRTPMAGEALYRAADIRWQMERSDVMTRPSARERDAYLRGAIDEEWMKLVIKKFPGSKWADLAAFHLIDNKLCGDWQGASKCPEKEADTYEKYVNDHA